MLILKYFKYCILKKPCKIYSFTHRCPNDISTFTEASVINFPTSFYKLTLPNADTAYAVFKNYKRKETFDAMDMYSTYHLKDTHENYDYRLTWHLVSIKDTIPINQCNWKQFKQYYAKLFKPYIYTIDEIKEMEAATVLHSLSPNKETINTWRLIRKI